MASPNAVFTEMVTTTLRNHKRDLADNVTNHNALLRAMKAKGKIDLESGGYEIVCPLEYAENSTTQRFSGYDLLNTAASDVLTAAKFDWRQIAIHVTASGREILQNSGENAMINLVKSRVKNAEKSAANFLSEDIYSDGSASNQVNGLGNLIQTNGQGTVGGINAATTGNEFWRNQFQELGGTDIAASPSVANAVTFKNAMNQLYLKTARGSDMTDMIVMSHDFFSLFEIGEQDKERYIDENDADAGFVSYRYKKAKVIFDDNTNFATTAEKAFFLNCDYLGMSVHKDANFTRDDDKKPTNQNAVVIPMYWMGNMKCSNRARQGVLFDAA